MNEPDLIVESKRLCSALEQVLPRIHAPRHDATFETIDGRSVTVKIPSKLIAVVGTLAWRGHDFATLACDLFDQQRIVPGAVIGRSLMETTALVYLIWEKTNQAVLNKQLDPLDDFLVRCMSGNRLGTGDPESPNVLTAIQALEKEPGCDRYADFYALLCEFAHPNSLGSFYAYSAFDDARRLVSFGQNRGMTKGNDVAFCVVFALEVLLEFLDKVQALLPKLTQSAKELYLHRNTG